MQTILLLEFCPSQAVPVQASALSADSNSTSSPRILAVDPSDSAVQVWP